MRKKPMLAYPVSNKPIDYTKPVFMQPKLDGVRCLIQYDDGKVTAYSRTGKVWKNIEHITLGLYRFFDKYPNVILDGELYNHDFKDDFESIISMVRKTKPTAEDRVISSDNVQFHCYDIVDEKLPFKQRIEFINNNLMLLSSSIKIVYTMQITSHENALTFHESFVAGGYEGSILRTNDVYACKRSHNLRKFKDFSDAEATIVGYLDGKGKRKGTLGKFLMVDADGVRFGCPPGKGYNYKDLTVMLKNIDDYIGKLATFTYFERTKANSYRHPLFKCIRDYE
jgi:DNA ligase-1